MKPWGMPAFRERLLSLYLMSLVEDYADEFDGSPVGNWAYTGTPSASTPAPRPSRPIDPSTVAPAEHISQPSTAPTDIFPFHLN